jgi:hypothetical protein
MRKGIDMDKSGEEMKIKENILMNLDRMAQLAESGYTVTIRKIKDGVKITSHKERVVK